ncbi:hypothetical protein [Pseudomonas sp. SCB32]|uniref:hypothetical protein n=1 Tax=Pseudomonas sp. SCB32 TaxID=2653853 RepID=UPI00211521AC|nr:hypothetical protein [Pseudomonas sp. SCB32]
MASDATAAARQQLIAKPQAKGSPRRLTHTVPPRPPAPPELEEHTDEHFQEHGPFSNYRNGFDYAVKMSGVNLPQRQRVHVLRYTFASHCMAHGGNLLMLQQVLGHTSLT